ncbi:hypothetical protein NVP1144O_06 [Vibrio phage 1.144.O._10N.286.45.B3]|nr:hypothetical protein NVP1144O_06 [Vibrio phage 1.144.O._10N.286.45.B3]
MTTYNSYQKAKIANPEFDIYWAGKLTASGMDDVFGTKASLAGITTNHFKCNPADHCMTVEKFLADGHKLAMEDIVMNSSGAVVDMNYSRCLSDFGVLNSASHKECILRAAALEEKPSEKIEWVNGELLEFMGEPCVFIGFADGLPVIKYTKDASCALSGVIDEITAIDELKKPETKQQREDRERADNGKALYELVQKIWCDVDSKYTANPYESGMVDDNVKEMYARLAIETNYRKESK